MLLPLKEQVLVLMAIVRQYKSGNDITPHTAPLHLLFTLSEIISIGIGDAGK